MSGRYGLLSVLLAAFVGLYVWLTIHDAAPEFQAEFIAIGVFLGVTIVMDRLAPWLDEWDQEADNAR